MVVIIVVVFVVGIATLRLNKQCSNNSVIQSRPTRDGAGVLIRSKALFFRQSMLQRKGVDVVAGDAFIGSILDRVGLVGLLPVDVERSARFLGDVGQVHFRRRFFRDNDRGALISGIWRESKRESCRKEAGKRWEQVPEARRKGKVRKI